jgi:hypothetical protein
MSMTELERHLLNCLEGLQQEFTSSQKFQGKRLAALEECQKVQETSLSQLEMLFKDLETLLLKLVSIIESA